MQSLQVIESASELSAARGLRESQESVVSSIGRSQGELTAHYNFSVAAQRSCYPQTASSTQHKIASRCVGVHS